MMYRMFRRLELSRSFEHHHFLSLSKKKSFTRATSRGREIESWIENNSAHSYLPNNSPSALKLIPDRTVTQLTPMKKKQQNKYDTHWSEALCGHCQSRWLYQASQDRPTLVSGSVKPLCRGRIQDLHPRTMKSVLRWCSDLKISCVQKTGVLIFSNTKTASDAETPGSLSLCTETLE